MELGNKEACWTKAWLILASSSLRLLSCYFLFSEQKQSETYRAGQAKIVMLLSSVIHSCSSGLGFMIYLVTNQKMFCKNTAIPSLSVTNRILKLASSNIHMGSNL